MNQALQYYSLVLDIYVWPTFWPQ